MHYIWRLDDPTKYSAHMLASLSWRLASYIAMPLTRDPKLAATACHSRIGRSAAPKPTTPTRRATRPIFSRNRRGSRRWHRLQRLIGGGALMADLRAYQPSFTAGELAPALAARVDLAKYTTGLKQAVNVFVHPHGGVSNRAGLEYVATIKARLPASRRALSASSSRPNKLIFSNSETSILHLSRTRRGSCGRWRGDFMKLPPLTPGPKSARSYSLKRLT